MSPPPELEQRMNSQPRHRRHRRFVSPRARWKSRPPSLPSRPKLHKAGMMWRRGGQRFFSISSSTGQEIILKYFLPPSPSSFPFFFFFPPPSEVDHDEWRASESNPLITEPPKNPPQKSALCFCFLKILPRFLLSSLFGFSIGQ
jgi:hypothetical protein